MFSLKTEIKIVADAGELSRSAAEILVRRVEGVLRSRDFFTIALSGGSTPRSLFSLLATDASLRERMPWKKVHFFWGDERHVPSDHPDSNFRMTWETMLSRVPVPAGNIHRIRAEDPDAGRVAGEYEKELKEFFKLGPGQMPRFDCVLLGMGPDGHTASLFPGTAAIREKERLTVSNWVEKFKAYRITLTVPVLNNADLVIFMVSGEDKAETLHAVLEGSARPDLYPSQLIRPAMGELLWLVDRAAASRLPGGGEDK